MRIEGLQAVKPRSPATSPTPVVGGGYVTDLGNEETILTTATPSNNIDNETPDEPVRKVRRLLNTLPNVTSTSGLDMEVHLVERGKEVDTVMGIGDWILHSFRAGVREPVSYISSQNSNVEVPCKISGGFKKAKRIISHTPEIHYMVKYHTTLLFQAVACSDDRSIMILLNPLELKTWMNRFCPPEKQFLFLLMA